MSGKEYLVFIWADTVTSVRDIRPHLAHKWDWWWKRENDLLQFICT